MWWVVWLTLFANAVHFPCYLQWPTAEQIADVREREGYLGRSERPPKARPKNPVADINPIARAP